ncbi:MAG: hypothetical protein FWG35_08700, partial [Spirochaetaceae bacterium]|nr:hypothetical protein [Spirochaetaceae bacterium]
MPGEGSRKKRVHRLARILTDYSDERHFEIKYSPSGFVPIGMVLWPIERHKTYRLYVRWRAHGISEICVNLWTFSDPMRKVSNF